MCFLFTDGSLEREREADTENLPLFQTSKRISDITFPQTKTYTLSHTKLLMNTTSTLASFKSREADSVHKQAEQQHERLFDFGKHHHCICGIHYYRYKRTLLLSNAHTMLIAYRLYATVNKFKTKTAFVFVDTSEHHDRMKMKVFFCVVCYAVYVSKSKGTIKCVKTMLL